MTKFSLIVTVLLLIQPCLANENFSLYLVRHAEKQTESKNPALTQCGKERAGQLATLLSSANIKSIYSTAYQRTMSTAAPLSKKQELAIKNYNPKKLDQFALSLKQRQENALIVGHSNTTPELVMLLSNQEVDALSENEYQFLYQLKFSNGKAHLTIFKQPLSCSRS